jgi:hypothetical protein
MILAITWACVSFLVFAGMQIYKRQKNRRKADDTVDQNHPRLCTLNRDNTDILISPLAHELYLLEYYNEALADDRRQISG